MLTAAAHPDLFRGLILVEAAPGGPKPRVPQEIGAWLDSWPVPFPSREAAVPFFGGGPVGEGWAAGLERHEDGWRPRFDRDVMVASVAENARRSFRSAWRHVACPTLVVLAGSSFVPAADIDAMLGERPETRAVCLPGTGHDVHLERPGVLHGLLVDFFEDLT
jgi:pimeloyl-ACP methyl ester carboxylesterase